LPGGALQQVIDAGHNHKPLSVVGQAESQVTVIGVQTVLNLRQLRCRKDAYPVHAQIEFTETCFHLDRRHWLRQPDIDGRQNPAWDRQQMRRENYFRRREIQLLENFSGMAVAEHRVSREVVRDRNEVGPGSRFLACTGNARLRVRDDSVVAVDNSGFHQRSERQDDGSCVTAGIRNQSGGRNLLPIQLG